MKDNINNKLLHESWPSHPGHMCAHQSINRADECPYLGITGQSKNLRENEMLLPSYA